MYGWHWLRPGKVLHYDRAGQEVVLGKTLYHVGPLVEEQSWITIKTGKPEPLPQGLFFSPTVLTSIQFSYSTVLSWVALSDEYKWSIDCWQGCSRSRTPLWIGDVSNEFSIFIEEAYHKKYIPDHIGFMAGELNVIAHHIVKNYLIGKVDRLHYMNTFMEDLILEKVDHPDKKYHPRTYMWNG